jgi:hypothetical protein
LRGALELLLIDPKTESNRSISSERVRPFNGLVVHEHPKYLVERFRELGSVIHKIPLR